MSLNETIDSLANALVIVKRHATGTQDAVGRYIPGALTTFVDVPVVIQPAFGLNRVVGGSDLHAGVDNQKVTTVLVLRTRMEMKTLTEDNDADIVTYKGKDYTVARALEWDLDGEIHYEVLITKLSYGGAA